MPTEEPIQAPLALKFEGEEKGDLVEVSAAQLAESLQGLVELASIAAKHGAFGDAPPPEVMVLPPERGSFEIVAILQWAVQNPGDAYTIGSGTLGTFVFVAGMLTKGLRAHPNDYEYLDNGNVKVLWSDKTVDEVPAAAWDALQKEKRRSKKALRKLMAPMSGNALTLEIESRPDAVPSDRLLSKDYVAMTVDRDDYRAAAVRHDEDEPPTSEVFEAEGRLERIDFGAGKPWKVTTSHGSRKATVEDSEFLKRVNEGLALKKTDIFRFQIREVSESKNGRRKVDWFIEKVLSHRKGGDDSDTASRVASHTATSQG
ncbi:hypothetical protein FOE78_17715 [Microlunatus elymi]|uniref:DUF7946 domain-containing protein n=1 Tax=Microlunatus elymi TaxID=2596828 RepID=A0A516Q262_9ACTN|nr:hypothetical protein [Microlunatus elymi]QDP97506.1 hypothetical protein FOE78_17715 [Microlunatus elymi]